MLEEIKKELSSIGKKDVDSKIYIKCGKTKFIELINFFSAGAVSIKDTLGIDLDSDEHAGFQFNKVFIPGYGHITFEHDTSLGDDEYKINII